MPRGTLAGRLSLLDAAIGTQSPPSSALVLALVARAELLAALGRPAEAREDRCRARELCTLVPGARLRADVDLGLAAEALSSGRLDEARALAEEALASYHALGARRSEVEGLTAVARILTASGDLDAAVEHAERAANAARAAGSERLELAAVGALGLALHELGDLDAAERHLESALARSRAAQDGAAEALHGTSLGIVWIERGEIVEAQALLERVAGEQRATGDRAHLASTLGTLGLGEEARGLTAAARDHYEEAAALHRDTEHAPQEGLTLAWSGRLEASRDRCEDARRALEEARSRLFAGGPAGLLVTYDLCEAHLSLAEARAAQARGDAPAASACLVRARRVLTAHTEAPPSVHVRLARASLSRALGAATAAIASPSPPATELRLPDPGLTVSVSALWFQAPGGERVSLATRRALRCILRRLADERDARPGEPLEVPALLEAGWPGERVGYEAGVSRVYAAVSHLRRDGLRDVLVRRDDGYLLDPGVALARAPD